MKSADIVRLGIRRVMVNDGLTQYKISKNCGLLQPQISRFMNGADARLHTLDTICNKGLNRTLLEVMQIGSRPEIKI